MARRIPQRRLDIYDNVTVYLFTDPADYDRFVDARCDPEAEPRPWNSVGMVRTAHQGDGSDGLPELHVLICLDARALAHEDTGVSDVIKTIAHEATHAAGLILDHIGEEYDGVSEAQAYLVGWLTKWAWEHLPARVRHDHV